MTNQQNWTDVRCTVWRSNETNSGSLTAQSRSITLKDGEQLQLDGDEPRIIFELINDGPMQVRLNFDGGFSILEVGRSFVLLTKHQGSVYLEVVN
jgi:hypothetical protein